MIFRRHVSDLIAAWVDGELDPARARRVEDHVAGCTQCRDRAARHRAVASLLRQAAPVEAPAAVWASIEFVLETGLHDRPVERWRSWAAPAWIAAAAAVLVITAGAWWWSVSRIAPWEVVRVDQSREARVRSGQWIETGAETAAAIRVGQIGRVDIEPGTRLQVVTASATEQRLNLQRGRISVEIVAPPRVFFVNTPASTVVDLGCAYTMDVAPDGSGRLRVTNGWASLEGAEHESLVPAGASATTRPAMPPGTPAFDDASARLREALDAFDYGADKAGALAVVLAEARPRDTLTLWHLMARVAASDRGRVFDRLVALTPLPAGVERERAMALDAATLRRWREELAWTW